MIHENIYTVLSCSLLLRSIYTKMGKTVPRIPCAVPSCLSLSRNPVCTQEQTGSRTYMSEKTAKRNEDNRFLHFHVANFFKFMAANLSFTQFVT